MASYSRPSSTSDNDPDVCTAVTLTVTPDQLQRRSLEVPVEAGNELAISSRRPSAIIAALRRPSQAIALSAAHAIMSQRKYMMGLLQAGSEKEKEKDAEARRQNRKIGDDALTTMMSALYAKLLVVLGMAFPITEIISPVKPFYYQGYYLYLYLTSIFFVCYLYASLIRERTVFSIISNYQKKDKPECDFDKKHANVQVHRYGSFYLRLGAIAFGIGSMVYSGLELGRYFELRNYESCNPTILQAFTPATRMILTIVQMQFIFLNSKELEMSKHKVISRFGLMHMIATNLCEWLYVLVEEARHEIHHLAHKAHLAAMENNITANATVGICDNRNIMSSLVQNASPFLFPCTIEYSLICGVIFFEMWKKIKSNSNKHKHGESQSKSPTPQNEKTQTTHYSFGPFGGPPHSRHHFSLDCSNAHKGLFAGILVIVLTIISLIMFFVLNDNTLYHASAVFEVNIVELVLYIVTTIAVLVAMLQMRDLKYERKHGAGMGLDNTLLVMAQTGMYIYCMFSIIACYFNKNASGGLLAELFSLIQTTCQTTFVLDAWWRRCRTLDQTKRKPGREIVTFLLVANMAMWTINTMEKNRAEFRPTHLEFFGVWAWTIITHVSMPLAIFYRFHSTICLFEIWKSAYKMKNSQKNFLFPMI